MRVLMMLGLAMVLAAITPATPVSAQGCYTCEDEFWTEVECGNQGWTGTGKTECEVDGSECNLSGDICWGPDPEEDAFALLSVSASGTVLPPAAMNGLSAEDIGLSPLAVLTERSCKGFITRRVYGTSARRELQTRATRIVI